MTSRRTVTALVGLVVAGLWWTSQAVADQDAAPSPAPSASSSSPAASSGHTAGELEQLLADVDVVDERTQQPGYDRDCSREAACVFGPAWADDHPGPGGHNGCDTRNDVLQRDLVDVEIRPGTNGCVVIAGSLDDPYTGQVLTFAKSRAAEVQVDHVYPLAAAWDLGASTWPPERRVTFANDQSNLWAVDGRANASKGDRTPGEWLPINRNGVCEYLTRFLTVAIAYDLPITAGDVDAVHAAEPTCVSDAAGKVQP